MNGAQTYVIMEGVRRAKAFELAGFLSVRAIVQFADGTHLPEGDIAIDLLRSPKATIDMSNNTQADRFWRIWNGLLSGQAHLLPPITITPGTHGTPIKNVGWSY